MRNKFFFIFLSILISLLVNKNSFADQLKIKSTEVNIQKKKSEIKFSGNVEAKDKFNNTLQANEAIYSKTNDLLKSNGLTKITTAENYILEGQDIFFDNKNNIIKSSSPATITDTDGNKISVEMFDYNSIKNVLFSKGKIELSDKNENKFKFTQIFIDEKKKKIIGSDAKLFFESEDFKAHPKNNPRIFANSVAISSRNTSVQKGVITYCAFRENDKCPPWEIQAKKIEHDNAKKTVYYNSAVLKIYDFPIFYFPRLSHPDPTVDRRSGFLVPSFANSTNVGFGVDVPFFWNISKDKDLTVTPRLHASNEPLYLAEYRQDFKNSFLILDGGFTEGYKKKTNLKTAGSRSHLFAKFFTSFKEETDQLSNLEINIQQASNETYSKINKLQTSLVDYLDNTLSNSVNYNYQKNDIFFNTKISANEDLSKTGNEKYEFIYPEALLEKNILTSEKMGIIDLKSELMVRNYEVDKQIDVLTNDFKWVSNSWVNKFGFENEFLGLFKNINYNAKNEDFYKSEKNVSEFYGALGLKSELGLFKVNEDKKTINIFKPKALIKISPSHSRNISSHSTRLSYSNIFELNKLNSLEAVDTGSSLSLGFDFKINNLNNDESISDEKFSFGIGQVINEKEDKNMPVKSSLNQKFSDIVSETKLGINKNIRISNNFSLDQNLRDLNYNQFDIDAVYPRVSFNLGYLEEAHNIGNQKYVNSKASFNFENSALSFSTKRNLLSNSSEFYNLSYEYINDCLRAGLAFRREFYKDRDLEPEDSLFFKITFSPLGSIVTPTPE